MSDQESINNEQKKPLGKKNEEIHDDIHDHEPIDEELLALSTPPPSIQQAIFIVIIIGFSLLVLGLFWPELRYFVKGFGEPTTLGEAADLDTHQIVSDSFVKVDGVPLVNRTVTFSTGTKWFSGDIYRKMAPLSGNPNLLVQWHTSNPQIKQAKDSLTPPSSFAGRLKKREELSENYSKFWPFYDCLKLHNTSQCKYCIGKSNLDECRPVFTCVDNYPIEVCDYTAFNTKEEVVEKIEELKAELQQRVSSDLTAELEAYQKALGAYENLGILSDVVQLEELFDRASMLEAKGEQQKQLLDTRVKILSHLVKTLEIRLTHPREKIATLSPALKQKLAQKKNDLATAHKELKRLVVEKKALRPLLDIHVELSDFVVLVKEQKAKLLRVDKGSETLADWKLDGKETGLVLLQKIQDLSAKLATLSLRPKEGQATASEQSIGNDGTDSQDTDTLESAAEDTANTSEQNTEQVASDENVSPEGDTEQPVVEPSLSVPTEPTLARIDSQLDDAIERVAVLGRVLTIVTPQDVPKLNQWAGKTDIVGSLPKPLRAEHVFKSFEMIAKSLKAASPTQTATLKARYRTLRDANKVTQQKIESLRATSGLAQLELVGEFNALQQLMKTAKSEKWVKEVSHRWKQISASYANKEFYPWDLSNYPKERQSLAQLMNNVNLAGLEEDIHSLEKELSAPMYVLLDDEKPTDNPWILFVYIAVPIMLVVNFRKLLRFISEWRQ